MGEMEPRLEYQTALPTKATSWNEKTYFIIDFIKPVCALLKNSSTDRKRLDVCVNTKRERERERDSMGGWDRKVGGIAKQYL